VGVVLALLSPIPTFPHQGGRCHTPYPHIACRTVWTLPHVGEGAEGGLESSPWQAFLGLIPAVGISEHLLPFPLTIPKMYVYLSPNDDFCEKIEGCDRALRVRGVESLR